MTAHSLDLKVPLVGAADRTVLPMVRPVRQHLDTRRVPDVTAAVAAELARPEIRESIKPGQRIAVGIGSRGISDYALVTARVIAELRALGAEPFIIPAVGGHGGGTAAGQLQILASLGITEATMHAPIVATEDAVLLGHLADGTPIYFDVNAARADGIVVINRIKPHTLFRGPVESGLTKMVVAGLGRSAGVAALHARGTERFTTLLPEAYELVRGRMPILFGLGLLENGYGELAHVEAVTASAIRTREPELLRQASESMAKILFEDIDVLVLAEFGKNISGQGADPNVIGRNARGVAVFGGPRVDKLVALDLTDASHGNASGVGMLDVVTARFLAKVDLANTYTNVMKTTYFGLAAIPNVARTSVDAVAVAVENVPGRRPDEVRLVYARDTKHLAMLYVSPSLYAHVEAHPRLELAGPERPLVDAQNADDLFGWD